MKTFLSIGSGPGMGHATAERFAKEGFKIVLSARSADKTKKLADELKTKGFEVAEKNVDTSNPSSIENLIAEVEKENGGIDVLHYNAASMRKATIEDQPSDSFNGDLAVNVGGALVAVKSAAPGMLSRKAGTILLTGGGFAIQPSPDYLSLSIGKAGIRAMAQGLFESFKERSVHIATVTVAGFVDPGTKQASEVGERFWHLHNQPQGSWTAEEIYTP